jgi:hypothetical protein
MKNFNFLPLIAIVLTILSGVSQAMEDPSSARLVTQEESHRLMESAGQELPPGIINIHTIYTSRGWNTLEPCVKENFASPEKIESYLRDNIAFHLSFPDYFSNLTKLDISFRYQEQLYQALTLKRQVAMMSFEGEFMYQIYQKAIILGRDNPANQHLKQAAKQQEISENKEKLESLLEAYWSKRAQENRRK